MIPPFSALWPLKLRGTSLEFSGNLTLKGAKEGPMDVGFQGRFLVK